MNKKQTIFQEKRAIGPAEFISGELIIYHETGTFDVIVHGSNSCAGYNAPNEGVFSTSNVDKETIALQLKLDLIAFGKQQLGL